MLPPLPSLRMSSPVLVVGAGFAGAVVARELAEAGRSVRVIDRRPHIGGNAFDALNDHGERLHVYGPHLLHGEADSVAIRWLSRFTEWVPYEHRVRAVLADGRTTPLPVNRTTLEDVFGVELATEAAAKELMASEVVAGTPSNTDEFFLANVGPRLADIFFRPYTRKMWGVPPTELEAAVGARLPVRWNRDDRYFTDSFQAMPRDGFTAMFERILDHPLISVSLGQAYGPDLDADVCHTFLSLPIDEYFDFRFGRLPYRSIRFETSSISADQPATVINYTDTGTYTRCTQWDLIPNSGRRQDGQHTVTREIPCDAADNNNECYYPVRNRETLARYEQYEALAATEPNKTFIGRCGLFRYLDMVPCVNIHLRLAATFLGQVQAQALA
jgi:UDP-galactopyranose mutase